MNKLSVKLLRGTILNPKSAKKCDFYRDGGLFIENEKIVDIGEFRNLEKKYKNVKVVNTKGVILPAFTDIHLHWVQNRVKGSFGGALLPWLKDHIWPEEAKFKDGKYAKKMANVFYKELLENGTKNAVIYSSVHKEATEIAIEMGLSKGNFIIGNVLMDQNSPDYLQMSTEEEIKIVKYFAKKYGPKYAITPRFAPTCSMELMKEVSKIAKEYGCFVQTHLSENLDEIAWVKQLFPEQKSYTEVYEKAGLLGKRTILGHCIHLSDKEYEILAKTGTKVAHCPTSNIALGSGTMNVKKMNEYKIPFALATDIGAGPKLSMIDVMESYIKVHKGSVTVVDALYRATLAGAEIMGISKMTGNLDIGKNANVFIVKDFMNMQSS